jgi:hypothetical protein
MIVGSIMDQEITLDREIASFQLPLLEVIKAKQTWFKLRRDDKPAGAILIRWAISASLAPLSPNSPPH